MTIKNVRGGKNKKREEEKERGKIRREEGRKRRRKVYKYNQVKNDTVG